MREKGVRWSKAASKCGDRGRSSSSNFSRPFSRSFRQAVGLPPHAYQMHLRLEHAKKLLARGCDVGYVACETGFFDQSHFTRHFKRNRKIFLAGLQEAGLD